MHTSVVGDNERPAERTNTGILVIGGASGQQVTKKLERSLLNWTGYAMSARADEAYLVQFRKNRDCLEKGDMYLSDRILSYVVITVSITTIPATNS